MVKVLKMLKNDKVDEINVGMAYPSVEIEMPHNVAKLEEYRNSFVFFTEKHGLTALMTKPKKLYTVGNLIKAMLFGILNHRMDTAL